MALTVLTLVLCFAYAQRGGPPLKGLTCCGFVVLGIVNLLLCVRTGRRSLYHYADT